MALARPHTAGREDAGARAKRALLDISFSRAPASEYASLVVD